MLHFMSLFRGVVSWVSKSVTALIILALILLLLDCLLLPDSVPLIMAADGPSHFVDKSIAIMLYCLPTFTGLMGSRKQVSRESLTLCFVGLFIGLYFLVVTAVI